MIRPSLAIAILALLAAAPAGAVGQDTEAHAPCIPGRSKSVCHPCYFAWLGAPDRAVRIPDFIVDEASRDVEAVHGSRIGADEASLRAGIRSRVEPVLKRRPAGLGPDEIRLALDALLRRLHPVDYPGIRGSWIVGFERLRGVSEDIHGPLTVRSGVPYTGPDPGGTAIAGHRGPGISYRGDRAPEGSTYRPPTSFRQESSTPPPRSRPARPATFVDPRSVPAGKSSQPVVTEVTRRSPPSAPAVPRVLPRPPPPPPPPRSIPTSPPPGASTPWTWILGGMIGALMLTAAIVNYRRAVRPSGPGTRGVDLLSLLDPADRALGAEGILAVAAGAADEEDWGKAMRYRFADLLLAIQRARILELSSWQTNLEIANGLSSRPPVAESFWAVATVFELFFFGSRSPTGSDYSMFTMLVDDCRAHLTGEGGAR